MFVFDPGERLHPSPPGGCPGVVGHDPDDVRKPAPQEGGLSTVDRQPRPDTTPQGGHVGSDADG